MSEDIAVMFADSHLKERTWSHRPIEGDSYHSFEQIIDYAVDNHLPVIAAGDLIDRNLNRSAPIVFLAKELRRLSDAGLQFFYIQGQHEMADVPWLDVGGEDIIHIHKGTINIAGVKIYGLDYAASANLQANLLEVPEDTDVLVAHQVWSDFMGSIANPQGGMHDVPHAKMVFTGDFHETHVDQVRNKQGHEMTVVSPGSTCMQSISEPHDKCFFVLQKHENGPAVRSVHLHTRPFVDWDEIIQTEDQMERFLASVDQVLEKQVDIFLDTIPKNQFGESQEYYIDLEEPLIRVEYSHRLERGAARIKAAIDRNTRRPHLFLKERPPQKPEVEQRRERRRKTGVSEAQTLIALLPAYLEGRELSHLGADTTRLLDAAEPLAELRRMKTEAIT